MLYHGIMIIIVLIFLRSACEKSNVRVVKILLEMGSDPNKHNILHDIIEDMRGNPAERDTS